MRYVSTVAVILSIGCGKSPEKVSTKAETPVATTWQAGEAWRVELGPSAPSPVFVAPLSDGSALVASYFEGTASVNGATFESRGDEDVLVYRISADGKLGPGTQLGGAGFDAAGAFVARRDRAYLLIQSRGVIRIAGKTVAPDGKGAVTALVTLDRNATPIAACALDIDASFYTLAMTAFADNDIVVAAETHGDPSITELMRVGPECVPRWRVPLGKTRVSALAAADSELIASTSGDDWLGLWRIDAATGKLGAKLHLTKPAGASAPDDLGGLAGTQRFGDRDIALGVTGGTAVLEGNEFSGMHLHPFFLASSPHGASYVPVADVVARVIGSGRVRGTPFFGMEVIHAGKPAEVHRGTYLIAFGTAPQLLPLYQYKYENDDWEHAPKQVVRGKQIRGKVAFSDDAAVIAGVCDDEATVRCIARFTLTAK